MGITRTSNRESNRPYLQTSEIQEIDARCKSAQGADAASDHQLVLTKLKLKLKSRVEKRKYRTRYNVEPERQRENGDIQTHTEQQM